jgi:hypothetical protein
METLIVPQDSVRDLDGLQLLLAGLERVTGGGKITARPAIVLETENKPAMWMLQDLLAGGVRQKQLPAAISLKSLPLVEQEAKTPSIKYKQRVKAYSILTGEHKGEKYTGQGLSSLLRNRRLEAGTVIHHPKHGNMTVVAERNGSMRLKKK